MVVKEEVASVATWRKGVQVVDLTRTGTPILVAAPDWRHFAELYAPGKSVNAQAVIATVPTVDPAAPALLVSLTDLKVGDVRIEGAIQRVVLGTGRRASPVRFHADVCLRVWRPQFTRVGTSSAGG